MTLYEEIEMQDLQRTVDSEASEVVRLREPIVPTKAQLEKVLIEVCKKDAGFKNCQQCSLSKDLTACEQFYYQNLNIVKDAISAWEKIRGTEPC